jgi:hypothetical protein
MQISVKTRAVAMTIAAGALFFVPLAAPAGAAQSVACASLTAPPAKNGVSTVTLAKCTPASLSAGAVLTSKSGQKTNTVKWKNNKGTTLTTGSYKLLTAPGKCPTGTARLSLTGKVTGGTGAAAKIIKRGEPVTASICAITKGSKTGTAYLEPGTKIKL